MLDAYGTAESWAEVVRVAVIRLRDLAEFSRLKANELGKPHLLGDAALYERDATHLEDGLGSP
jgi:hypothetical protein